MEHRAFQLLDAFVSLGSRMRRCLNRFYCWWVNLLGEWNETILFDVVNPVERSGTMLEIVRFTWLSVFKFCFWG